MNEVNQGANDGPQPPPTEEEEKKSREASEEVHETKEPGSDHTKGD